MGQAGQRSATKGVKAPSPAPVQDWWLQGAWSEGGLAFAAAAGGRAGRGAGGAKSRAGPRREPSGAGFGLRQRAGQLSLVSQPLRRTLRQ